MTSLPLGPQFLACIDQFSLFDDFLLLKGWAFHPKLAIRGMELLADGARRVALDWTPLPSDDVVAVHGKAAARSRFVVRHIFRSGERPTSAAVLRITLADRSIHEIVLGAQAADPARQLYGRFRQHLADRPAGNILEIGSRARSGVVRRNDIPAGWNYTGLDVLAGENVDLVGDAHRLSALAPRDHYHAVLSVSVLEHILMPWRLVLELNKVMTRGGIGFFLTHQNWPLHDRPWDFWRFSADAWPALFNPRTGFRILEAQMGEPAFAVAGHWHPVVDFAEGGYLASAVMIEKTGETDLDWPVELDEILASHYPA